MLHPIYSTVLGHPELIADHLANYGALLREEAQEASRSLIARTVAGVLAVVSVMLALGLIGVAIMAPKAYHDPQSETLATYALASVSGALAATAVGTLDASLLAYPIYYCVINAATAILLHHRRVAVLCKGCGGI